MPLAALELEQVARLDLLVGARGGRGASCCACATCSPSTPASCRCASPSAAAASGSRVAPAGRFKVRYAPPLVAAVEAILGPPSVVPVLQEPPSYLEEPDELLPTEDVDMGEYEAEALVS